MKELICTMRVVAGVLLGTPIPEYTREWHFTKEEMEAPPAYIDGTGAALNYAMSLQNPKTLNWVKMEWIWY